MKAVILNYSGLPLPANFNYKVEKYDEVKVYSASKDYQLEKDIWEQALEHLLLVGNVFNEEAEYILMLPQLTAPAIYLATGVEEIRGITPKIAHVTRIGYKAQWLETVDLRAWKGNIRGRVRNELRKRELSAI